ncbi:MAG TPA: hypothetical protein VFS55_04990 [Dokdonella sp.]|nr:hypothetical protein [Dokdonella sp.]
MREPHAFEQSCAYLDRRDAIAAADADGSADSLEGIYDVHTGTVGAELALGDDGWAGYHESSDAGVGRAGITGRYAVRDGRLVVDLDRSTGGPRGSSRLEYVVVRWSRHVFLIPPAGVDELLAMLDLEGLAGTTILELHQHMQRRRHRAEPLCGSPELPPEWQGHLHPDPLRLVLVDARIDDSAPSNPYLADMRRYRVTVDAGSADGVFAGMWLEGDPAQFPGADIFGQVDDVDLHRARGRVAILGDRGKARGAVVSIGKGTRVTSGRGWRPDACVSLQRSGDPAP